MHRYNILYNACNFENRRTKGRYFIKLSSPYQKYIEYLGIFIIDLSTDDSSLNQIGITIITVILLFN